jgi:hypothetical protein
MRRTTLATAAAAVAIATTAAAKAADFTGSVDPNIIVSDDQSQYLVTGGRLTDIFWQFGFRRTNPGGAVPCYILLRLPVAPQQFSFYWTVAGGSPKLKLDYTYFANLNQGDQYAQWDPNEGARLTLTPEACNFYQQQTGTGNLHAHTQFVK